AEGGRAGGSRGGKVGQPVAAPTPPARAEAAVPVRQLYGVSLGLCPPAALSVACGWTSVPVDRRPAVPNGDRPSGRPLGGHCSRRGAYEGHLWSTPRRRTSKR